MALAGSAATIQPAGSLHADAKMLARSVSLGACAGGIAGLLIGGVGGRLAMLLLRFTTETPIKGIESDDGFTMGQFTIGSTLSLLMVCAVLGSIGGLIVIVGRPFFSRRFALVGWPLAAGAIVGSTIIKSDGVDFTLLEPKALAVAMFIAIPAAGAFVITWLIYRWEAWWWADRKRTIFAATGGLPALVFFPLGVVATAVALIWLVALRFGELRRLNSWQPVRVLALLVFAALTALGLMSLGGDISDVL